MTTATLPKATLQDLYKVEGKAELIGGKIHRFMASGDLPSQIAFEIAVHLRAYAKRTGRGMAYGDGVGFAVPELRSGRESFSPDAAYFVGAHPANRMRFVEGAPLLAVEVRSENDYGERAGHEMAAKRADYFASGTLVVWDVDPVTECIHVYHASTPAIPKTYRFGEQAEAEPALPGFSVDVKSLWS